MQIEIGSKKYALVFGTGFIRKMDKMHTINANGASFGAGISSAAVYLQQKNPTIIVDIINASLGPKAPNEAEIDTWIIEQGVEKVCGDFLEQLQKQPLTKAIAKQITKAMKAV